MFDLLSLKFPGCFEVIPRKIADSRGVFVKTFHYDTFRKKNLETSFKEEFYSVSAYGVIRGLHFQLPPQAHTKLVYCTEGSVQDVIVDLREGSPSFKKVISLEISADKANLLYLPAGIAHGFCVTSKTATMMYKVSTVYHPELDSGILWSSIGFDWGIKKPVLSERDQSFTHLEYFKSPFSYE